MKVSASQKNKLEIFGLKLQRTNLWRQFFWNRLLVQKFKTRTLLLSRIPVVSCLFIVRKSNLKISSIWKSGFELYTYFEASLKAKMPRSFLITNRRYKKLGGCLLEIPAKPSVYIDKELEEVDNGDSLSYASTPTDALSRGKQIVYLTSICWFDNRHNCMIWSVMISNWQSAVGWSARRK